MSLGDDCESPFTVDGTKICHFFATTDLLLYLDFSVFNLVVNPASSFK